MPVSRIVKNLLIDVKLTCSNEYCDEVIPYDDINSHLAVCEFSPTVCTGCKKELTKKSHDDHKLRVYKKHIIRPNVLVANLI